MIAAAVTCLVLALPFAGAWRALAMRTGDARLSFALAALAWAAWAVAVAELLPVDRTWYGAAWAAPAGWGAWVIARVHLRSSAREWRRRARRSWQLLTWIERAGWVVIAVLVVLTLLTALVAAPNNWDSMVYHLARVAQWVQLGDVAHYATNIEPQLYQPPGAEELILQSYVLAGSDVLAALVQWGAYVGCVVLAHRAAEALGDRAGGARVRLGAALLVATCPLAILEASSTQNDLVLGFWLLLALVLSTLLWRRVAEPELPGRTVAAIAVAASLALGMAVLTKGTGLLFGAPVGVLLAACVVRRLGFARAAVLAAVGVVAVALPNAGQWARNHATYGSFVATEHAGIANPYRVQDPGPGTLVANLVRNATNHLDLPLGAANDAIERGTVHLLGALGVDANDPRSTFLGQPFRVGPFGPHEDHAGSLLLLVLGLWAGASIVHARVRGAQGSGVQLAWLGIVTAQVLVFCWLITWQNWHVRLHLPVTVVVAVLVAVRLGARRSMRALAIVGVLAAGAAPVYALFNVTRPLVGGDSVLVHSRAHARYLPRPELRAPYAEVVRRVADQDRAQVVGLVTGIDDWQYPLLTAFAQHDVRVREVLVSGPSRVRAAHDPDDLRDLPALVCVGCTPAQQTAIRAQLGDPVALEAGDADRVQLWLRATPAVS